MDTRFVDGLDGAHKWFIEGASWQHGWGEPAEKHTCILGAIAWTLTPDRHTGEDPSDIVFADDGRRAAIVLCDVLKLWDDTVQEYRDRTIAKHGDTLEALDACVEAIGEQAADAVIGWNDDGVRNRKQVLKALRDATKRARKLCANSGAKCAEHIVTATDSIVLAPVGEQPLDERERAEALA